MIKSQIELESYVRHKSQNLIHHSFSSLKLEHNSYPEDVSRINKKKYAVAAWKMKLKFLIQLSQQCQFPTEIYFLIIQFFSSWHLWEFFFAFSCWRNKKLFYELLLGRKWRSDQNISRELLWMTTIINFFLELTPQDFLRETEQLRTKTWRYSSVQGPVVCYTLGLHLGQPQGL